MTLSTSRQQFLAYETHATENNIQYGRKRGFFVSHCICVGFVVFAIIVAVIVGIIAHYITYFKLSSQNSTQFWDETEPFGQSQGPPSIDLRLPPELVPRYYRLKLIADLDNSNFSGKVAITLRSSSHIRTIILHSKDLKIIKDNAKLTEQNYEKVATVNSRSKREDTTSTTAAVVESIPNATTTNNTTQNTTTTNGTTPNSTTPNGTTPNSTISNSTPNSNNTITSPATTIQPSTIDTQITTSNAQRIQILSITPSTGDRLVIFLASTLKPDIDYILELSFEGKISESLTGFYKSTYRNKDKEEKMLGVTQFEPTSARAAFPCFDEPGFKAKFEISIAHVQNITVLSNMKVIAEEPMADRPNWVWTHFDRSVEMSTYLVAYVLSDFQSLETTYLSNDGLNKTIRVWTRPELVKKANYALTITPKLLDFYEEVFGVPYALDKLDLVAIPDFSSGAMENWGLITFRETTLLFDEAEGIPRDKQNVAIDVAHELAHQWFGNLVTMRWWSDLWLNEGFATYIEYVGVDHIEPEWKMFQSFSRDKMDLLRSDALKNTSPVAREVVDASEISQKFDEISYTKGANLIRMLNHTISEELFHKGLVVYLNDWKYSNAEENDLWTAMAKGTAGEPTLADVNVVEFMNSWTRQAGYPVVKVSRNYLTGTIELEQRLFTSSKQPYQASIDQIWQIPISYTTMDTPMEQWSTKPKVWMTKWFKVVEVANVTASQALYVNVNAIGYYRVNYDEKNWQMLSSALKSGNVRSPITKAQLIDDAFNLAKASQLDYSYALGLTTCVIDGEDSKIVWDLLLNNMGFLRYNLRATPGFVYFQDYMSLLLKKQLEKLNYGLDKPKDDNEAFLIENLVMWECYVESPRCVDWAKKQFDSWASQPDLTNNPIPSYLRSLVYSMALRHGGRREFDFLWQVFLNSTDPNVRSLVINVLPSTRQDSLIASLLEKSLTEIPKQYAVAVWSVEPPVGARIAQNYLVNNFDRVYERFTAMDPFMFPAVLNAAFGFITDTDELDRLKSFALQHKEKLLPMSQTLQKLVDTATLRIDWVQKYARTINRWFEDYITGKLSPDGTSPLPVNVTTLPTDATTAAPNR